MGSCFPENTCWPSFFIHVCSEMSLSDTVEIKYPFVTKSNISREVSDRWMQNMASVNVTLGIKRCMENLCYMRYRLTTCWRFSSGRALQDVYYDPHSSFHTRLCKFPKPRPSPGGGCSTRFLNTERKKIKLEEEEKTSLSEAQGPALEIRDLKNRTTVVV